MYFTILPRTIPLRLNRLGPSMCLSPPKAHSVLRSRTYASSGLIRPSPPPLPREQQREFEELQRAAQMPLSSSGLSHGETEAELALHPDARKPVKPDFDGDINPLTGEQGGPKTEPVRKWVEEDGGDWSFKGRVSDF